jgi:hypothetical protein
MPEYKETAASIKLARKKAKMRLRKELCGSCPHASINWSDEKFFFGVDGLRQPGEVVTCDLKPMSRIGFVGKDGKAEITGQGVPTNCPCWLEYMMLEEQKVEDQKAFKRMSPTRRALEIAKRMRR